MVGLVFQYPERQLFAGAVIDDAMFGPRNLGHSDAEARVDAQWALEAVGLTEAFWKRNPFSLSGGEQRRAAFAGVLAMRPRVLALDEPTAGQDPARRQELASFIAQLRDQGIGVLLATHDMELLSRCDEVTVLHQGRAALQGPSLPLFAEHTADLQACGLDPPEAIQFSNELRSHNVACETTLNEDLLADSLIP
jgi:energy-coupling factor transporter ATP-binding protein EcfA2